MDFHHVLPSNTSPNYFPNNNAAEYSTPLDNPYVLSGNWEVGLMDLTYSTCVNTFNNDNIVIDKETLIELAAKSKNPIKVMLPIPTSKFRFRARSEMIHHINKTFKTLLKMTITDEKFCSWEIGAPQHSFIFSSGLVELFQMSSDVITPEDDNLRSVRPMTKVRIPRQQHEVHIILIPKNVTSEEEIVTLKEANEKITPNQLKERFQNRISIGIAELAMHKNKFFLRKIFDDKKLILLNAPFRRAMTFLLRGMYNINIQKFYASNFDNMAPSWTFTIKSFKKIVVFEDETTKVIALPPYSFTNENDAIAFVNSKVNDKRIVFSFNEEKRITLTITAKRLRVTLDDTLRDIFAFDKNIYIGKKTYVASGSFSLHRCIQFLYIYSNITEYVRIGNTEAPLLAIVPFSNSDGCPLLKEKIFKTPMYLPVKQNHISQIDIGIYDGAGQLVPFVADSKTSLRLHFHQT